MMEQQRRRAFAKSSVTIRGALTTVALMVLGFVVAGMVTAVAFDEKPPASHTAPSPKPSATSSPTPSPSTDPVTYKCWGGRKVKKLSKCPAPKGTKGLMWVYPTFKQLKDRLPCKNTVSSLNSIGKLEAWECFTHFRGDPVRYRFSYWRSLEESKRHYQDDYSGGERKPFVVAGRVAGTRYQTIGAADRNGVYVHRLSAAYADWKFSMSVESTAPGVIRKAFAEVQFRPLDQMRGKRLGD